MASLVQHVHAQGDGSASVTVTGVTAGNSLVLAYSQWSTATRTYTATIGGVPLTAVTTYNPRGAYGIRVQHAVAAGDHTVVLTANTGSTRVFAWVFEVAGLDTGAAAITPTGGGATDAAATDNHISAPSGEIDTAGGGFIVTVGGIPGSVTSTSAGAGYTGATAASTNQAWCQYKIATGAVTDDNGPWTSVGTDRVAEATMAAFPDISSSSGGSWVSWLL